MDQWTAPANIDAKVVPLSVAKRAVAVAAVRDDLIENLGIAVRQLREKQGWSQEQLADRSGLNRSYVGEVERGRVVASVLTAQKLAQAFDVSVVELFSRCENIEHLRRKPHYQASAT